VVREALSGCAKIVAAVAAAFVAVPAVAQGFSSADAFAKAVKPAVSAGDAAIAEALVLARPMPAADAAATLPPDAQKRLQEYRQRERSFKSGLATPRGASVEERELYAKRVDIERVIFSLFSRKDSAKVAAGYALDADLDREVPFIDGLLRNLPVPWLAPYLNLIAGHRKLCTGDAEGARRHLTRARDGGHPLIRVAAEYLITTGACAQE
jgi:hypothetical protein